LVVGFVSLQHRVLWSKSALDAGPRPFSKGIPSYIDYVHSAQKLANELAGSAGDEKRLLTVIDMPGTGKTATVAEAARRIGAKYLHLSMKDQALSYIVDAMKCSYKDDLDGLTGNDVYEKMANVARLLLARVLLNAAQDTTPTFTTLNNGKLAAGLSDCIVVGKDGKGRGEIAAAMRAVTETLGSTQKVVIGVDEAQMLASPKEVDLRRLKVEPATIASAGALLLTALMDAFYDVQSLRDDRFRVVVIGTLDSITTAIHIASPGKFDPWPPLPEFTAAMVEAVVTHFASFPACIDKAFLSTQVYEKLCGPARSTQFFLHALWESTHGSVQLNVEDILREAVSAAKIRWAQEVLSRMGALVAFPRELSAELFLAMVVPFAVGGTTEGNSSAVYGHVVKLPTSVIPTAWLTYADAGAFRFKHSVAFCVLYPAYPFLRDELAARCKIVEPAAANLLLSQANAAWSNRDAAGGKIAQIMLALEAAIPSSPLHMLVFCATKLHTPFDHYGPAYVFQTDNQLRLHDESPRIGLVDDSVRGRGRQARWADTVVPIRFDQKTAAAYCEMKHVAYENKSKAQADVGKHVTAAAQACAFDSGVPDGSVFAFLSVHPTQLDASIVEGLLMKEFTTVVKMKATKKPLRVTFKVTSRTGRVVYFVLAELVGLPTTFRFDLLRETIDVGRVDATGVTLGGIMQKLAPDMLGFSSAGARAVGIHLSCRD
jgi:hypothetical protein